MIILPTMGRPQNLKRFVERYQATEGTLPIYVVLDAADAHNYNEVSLPSHFVKHTVPAGYRLGDIFNSMFRNSPNDELYGMVADDVVPETTGWDVRLRAACLPNKIAWAFDGLQNDKLPTHPFIGGELVRKLGWWSAPGLKHWYVDNVWKIVADQLGVAAYLSDVRMMHYHPVNKLAPTDATYANQPSHDADEQVCQRFLKQGLAAALQRART